MWQKEEFLFRAISSFAAMFSNVVCSKWVYKCERVRDTHAFTLTPYFASSQASPLVSPAKPLWKNMHIVLYYTSAQFRRKFNVEIHAQLKHHWLKFRIYLYQIRYKIWLWYFTEIWCDVIELCFNVIQNVKDGCGSHANYNL